MFPLGSRKIPDCGTSHIGGIGGTKSGKCRCRHKKGVRPEAKQFHTLTFGDGEGRTEYTVSNQHNGYTRMAMSCRQYPILAVESVPWGKVSMRTANGTALRIRRRE